MRGKEKCRILKEIRKKIASENDIEYVTHECRFQGECSGTCPKCESKLKYLEKQIEARAAAGKRIAIAAICAGMSLGLAGCTHSMVNTNQGDGELSGDVAIVDDGQTISGTDVKSGDDYFHLTGDVIEKD